MNVLIGLFDNKFLMEKIDLNGYQEKPYQIKATKYQHKIHYN